MSFIFFGIEIVFSSIWLILKELFLLMRPIFFGLLIITIINIVYRYKKYGKQLFSSFKKRKIINIKQDLIYNSLNKIKDYKKIILSDDFYSDYILIHKTGIHIIKVVALNGVITGNENNDYLMNNKNKVENIFKKLKNDEVKITERTKFSNVNKLIIIDDGCFFNLKHDRTFKIVYFKNFFSVLDFILRKKEIYTNENIENIFNTLIKEV